tara:strand:- start:79 stop:555 length:477 start_codon:yes stop_codon:yes gene_type:complete
MNMQNKIQNINQIKIISRTKRKDSFYCKKIMEGIRNGKQSKKESLQTISFAKIKHKERRNYFKSLNTTENSLKDLYQTLNNIIDSYGYDFLFTLRSKSYLKDDISNDLLRIESFFKEISEIYDLALGFYGKEYSEKREEVIDIKPLKIKTTLKIKKLK